MVLDPIHWLARQRNRARKLLAGLTPRGESVWPGVENDLFVAHTSIYHFFARHAAGAEILDLGCGAGYGSRILLGAGAKQILALDIDRRSIAYARRHFADARVEFRVEDCDRVELPPLSCDLAVSSNVFEHLSDPPHLLATLRRALRPGGRIFLAIPPIFTEHDFAVHGDIEYHRSNYTVFQWIELFSSCGFEVKTWAHTYGGGEKLDFRSPFRSKAKMEDFAFARTGRLGAFDAAPITAIYELAGPSAAL